MRLHQVLTGAANVLDDSVAVGHGTVAGYPFTVYGSGYEIVILDSHFNRIQIISSHNGATSIVRSIACCPTEGKVAVSFGSEIILYEAQPANTSVNKKLPFQWKKLTVLNLKSDVTKICWDQDGKRLLVGSDSLTIWRHELCENDEKYDWNCVWERMLATPVKLLEFSPDGHFFATAAISDCLIKIWFRAPRVALPSQQQAEGIENYNFIYIHHPAAVQSFSWRQTSKHMPMCLVPNVLLTSCADNVCRVWAETVKYKCSHKHALSDAQQQQTKNKQFQKERAESDIKLKTTNHISIDEEKTRSSSNQNYHLVSMYHFHLAAIINPHTDIALLSAIPTQSIFGRSFQLKWLNNKEVELTTAIEAIFASLKEQADETEPNTSSGDPFLLVDNIDGELSYEEESGVNTLDQTLEEDQMDLDSGVDLPTCSGNQGSLSLKLPAIEITASSTNFSPQHHGNKKILSAYQEEMATLVHRWCSTSDTIYCIHPVDGSLLIWVIDYLDDFTSACYRQVQVSFASRLPSTFSKADASSLCWSRTFHYTETQLMPSVGSSSTRRNSCVNSRKGAKELTVLQSSYMISAHADGSLNLWLVTFSESGSFTGIASVTHITRSCGPRFETTRLVCHPVLPLVIGTSLRTKTSSGVDRDADTVTDNDIESELILWHTDHVSPLSEFKGVTEMARISSPNPKKFLKISWIPTLYHYSLLSLSNNGVDLLPNAPCACFVAASNKGLHLYEILLDAKSLLSSLSMLRISTSLPHHMELLSDLIESEQSGSQSACIMKVCELENSSQLPELEFLHVFSEKTLQTDNPALAFLDEETKTTVTQACKHEYGDFVVVAIFNEFNQQRVSVWSLKVTFDNKFDVQHSSPITPSSVHGDLSPMTPTSPSLPQPLPVSLVVSHCLKQKLEYEDDLSNDLSTIKQFSAASDVHSSMNQNLTLPVKFHIAGYTEEAVKFWTIRKTSGSNEVAVVEITDFPTNLEWTESIVVLECADHCRFAYIARIKNNTDNKSNYFLHVKESESCGDEYWNNEYCTSICNGCEDMQAALIELSWLSLENGLYMLAVSINNSVYMFCKKRVPVLGSAKGTKHLFKWELLKQLEIGSECNDSVRLTTISWSGGGFFMIGVENEIQVYSHWEDDKHVVFRRRNAQTAILNENADEGVILTSNSFTVACEKMKCLPQYHPDHLMQLLNLGKLRRVRAILRHLVRSVAGFEAADAAAATGDMEAPVVSRARTLTKTYSNLTDDDAILNELSIGELKEKQDLDIDIIPPLMLTKLLEADKDQSGKLDNDSYENDYIDLSNSAVFYGLAQASLLSDHLSRKHLPGLSSQHQMYLLALSDTIASSKNFDLEGLEMDETRKYRTKESESNYSSLSGGGGGGGYATTGATGVGDFGSDSLDECGLKYLILLRHHTALLKSLSPKQKSALEEKGMLSAEYCWAFHSDCDEELVAMLPGMSRNEPTWSELRTHGAGWWIRSNEVLKRIMEKVAKTHFQLKKDPLDCAIFYLAMKKKTLLCALYRSLRDTKMSTFFSNDFTQDRWRKAALKNAYALLGKQRFEHAAAFFLLGNALWDAIQVCVTRLDDMQLALVIARLFDNSMDDAHRTILCTYIVGYEDEQPCNDPFKRSMAHWLLKEYHASVDVLLVPFKERNAIDDRQQQYDYPSIFNFYNYLRTHPLIRRCHLVQHRSQSDCIRSSLTSQSSATVITSAEDLHKYERALYFSTACIHLNSGLPGIALEVLSMLPARNAEHCADDTVNSSTSNQANPSTTDMIITGTLATTGDSSKTIDDSANKQYSSLIDTGGWGAASDNFSAMTNRFADLDDGYKISISLSDDDDEEEDQGGNIGEKGVETVTNGEVTENPLLDGDKLTADDSSSKRDVAALNLKYKCIIQLLIEGLKVLPVKCTQEKLRLRTTLKTVLQEELDFLHAQCDYENSDNSTSNTSIVDDDSKETIHESKPYRSMSSVSNGSSTSLEETSIVEKVEQISIQSKWLKRNQQILSRLYEHCLMIGTGDPELPAVCLELLLLLHEIEDHRVLNVPLTSISVGPSAPPLLLASMTSFSLVATPIAFLQSMTHDLLQTVIDLPSLPTPDQPVKRLADLENLMCSLSSCIYHSLCGGDDDRLLASIKKGEAVLVGKQMKDGKVCRIPHGITDVDLNVTSSPPQWPGVKFFLSILSVNKKDDRNMLNWLLCEAAIAIYLSMLVSACSRLSCNNLYRYVLNALTEDMWSNVFGGGTKIVISSPESTSQSPAAKNSSSFSLQHPKKDASRSKFVNRMLRENAQETSDKAASYAASHAAKTQASYSGNEKLLRHELFVPPNLNLCDYFLKKPRKASVFNYDSDNEESDDDDDDDNLGDPNDTEDEVEDDGLIDEQILRQKREEIRRKRAKLTEHFDSTSYPWLMMQLALVEVTIRNINGFIALAGVEASDIPTKSPLLYNATKVLLRWVQILRVALDSYPPREESLISFYSHYDNDGFARGGVALKKTKVLLDPDNTPFSNQGRRVLPAKRLWHTLVQQEAIRPLFLHYAFKCENSAGDDATDFEVISGHLLHKDPEPVTNLCFNKSNMNFMAISTTNEIIEYDVSGSMEADMMADCNDTDLIFDMIHNKKQSRGIKSSTPVVIQRRTYTGVRRMDSHPSLPYYVTGGTDGSIRMFEFIHPDQIALFRNAGQSERVNKIQFNSMGNKFGAVDDSGNLTMWLVSNTQDTTPICSLKCHSKYCLDFAFLGSSTVIATVGSGTDKKNVCIWDTLLPQKKALLYSFVHLHGAQSVAYVASQQAILTGGKRGDICVFNIRQRRLLHTFQAHDALIKIIRLDPAEMFFVSGSVDGDIKVWNLSTHEVLETYTKEHTRATVSLRQTSPGVQCLLVMSGYKLFSCGGDGTVKWRQIRNKRPKL